MGKYVRCDCCGNRIDFGDLIFRFPGYCGIHCSADCFADAYGDCLELNEDEAAKSCRKVYDDNEDKRRIEEDIAKQMAEIEELKRKLELNKVLLTQYE